MISAALLSGTISIIITVVSYFIYMRGMYTGKTVPHTFSWFVFALLGSVVAAGQIYAGGGLGAMPTAITGFFCWVIAIWSFKRGEKNIRPTDWIALAGGIAGIILWLLTGDPLNAMIVITTVYCFGFYPTFRKSWHKPGQEPLSVYWLTVAKWVTSLVALHTLSLTTTLYPVAALLINLLFIALVVMRRRRLKA
jgi:hypothetical protein